MPKYERYVEYTDTIEINPTDLARLVVDMDEAEHIKFMEHLEALHNDRKVCYFCGHEGDKPTPEESARIAKNGAIAEARADLAARDSMCNEFYDKIGEMAEDIDRLKKELDLARKEEARLNEELADAKEDFRVSQETNERIAKSLEKVCRKNTALHRKIENL